MARLAKSMKNLRGSQFERIAFAAMAVAGTTVDVPQARAGLVPLGDAAKYAALDDGTGGHDLSISNVAINRNLGVGRQGRWRSGSGRAGSSSASRVTNNRQVQTSL